MIDVKSVGSGGGGLAVAEKAGVPASELEGDGRGGELAAAPGWQRLVNQVWWCGAGDPCQDIVNQETGSCPRRSIVASC